MKIKTNPALVLLSFLSLGAIYQLQAKDSNLSLKELDHLLSELSESIQEYSSSFGEDAQLQDCLSKSQEDYKEWLRMDADLKKARREYKGVLHGIELKIKDEGKRRAQAYKMKRQGDLELLSKRIYSLEKSLNAKRKNIQSFWVPAIEELPFVG